MIFHEYLRNVYPGTEKWFCFMGARVDIWSSSLLYLIKNHQYYAFYINNALFCRSGRISVLYADDDSWHIFQYNDISYYAITNTLNKNGHIYSYIFIQKWLFEHIKFEISLFTITYIDG